MEIEVASIVKQMMTAGESWEAALDAHALAPPDAGFPARLRALSNAAAEQAAAFELAAEGGLGWRPRTVEGLFSLAPELTPGMTRPGPEELWRAFDDSVSALADALAGSSPAQLATAFSQLADASAELASELQRTYARLARAEPADAHAHPPLHRVAAPAPVASRACARGDRERVARAPCWSCRRHAGDPLGRLDVGRRRGRWTARSH